MGGGAYWVHGLSGMTQAAVVDYEGTVVRLVVDRNGGI